MKSVIVLGCGMIGSAIAKDLSQNYSVKVADINEENLSSINETKQLKKIKSDVTDKETLKSLIDGVDIVIGALPSKIGFKILKDVITLGKDIVDISFFNENPFELSDSAADNKVTAVIDCGVAPGLSNIILGYHTTQMNIENYKCLVGGLPQNPEPPFFYKAPFSPLDVIEEYTRPARIIKHGEISVLDPLTDEESIQFDNTIELEAFLTDGLRTLLATLDIKNMAEKTIRYPGHLKLIKALRDAGFFEEESLFVNGNKIIPLEFTSTLLKKKWQLKKNEKEFTVMRLEIEGWEAGIEKKYVYDLYDEYDNETETTSMARTTGYTCSAVADLILSGKFNRKGIIPPEIIGTEPGCKDEVLKYLADRGVEFKVN